MTPHPPKLESCLYNSNNGANSNYTFNFKRRKKRVREISLIYMKSIIFSYKNRNNNKKRNVDDWYRVRPLIHFNMGIMCMSHVGIIEIFTKSLFSLVNFNIKYFTKTK